MEEEPRKAKMEEEPRKATQLSMTNNIPPVNKNTITAVSPGKTKRLLFDRRYGWVIDEWKDPAQEALTGGRGMFCVLPLATGLIQKALNSIDMVTDSAVQIIERRDQISLQQLQFTVCNQLQQLGATVSKPVTSLLTFKSNLFLPTNSSTNNHKENTTLREPEAV